MGKNLVLHIDGEDDGDEIYGIDRHLNWRCECERYPWDSFRENMKRALENNDWQAITIFSAVLAHIVANNYGDGTQPPFDYIDIQYD